LPISAERCDAAHDGAEHHRCDHHLDQLDETVAERLEGGAELGPVVADGDAEDQADEDLYVEQLEQFRDVHGVVSKFRAHGGVPVCAGLLDGEGPSP
jgi:hypothetical protein